MSPGPFSGRRLHFIGIGGAGMSGLALVSKALGAEVTGSDRADSPYLEPLRAAGIEPSIGHDAVHLPERAEAVVSTAIPEDNPELTAARERGAPILHRGDLLGEVSHLKRSLAVGGAHGKTTTASMIAHVLRETGRDPAFLIGGELRSAGIEPSIGHDAVHLPERAEAVVSTAIPEDNPELTAARERGAPILHRGDLLGEVSHLKRSLAVGGAHGKTTTASMIAHVLRETGRDPAFLIGGELRSAGANAAWGEGEWVVVEADESDRSFLKLAREVAVVTNVELDHHSTYASMSELMAAYEEFARPAALRVLGPGVELPGESLHFGIEEGDVHADTVELTPGGSRFSVEGTSFELPVPGLHNVSNALATLAALRPVGVEPADAAAAFATFPGAGRRFEDHGQTPGGARVFDDYAHHPTEVRATLEGARTLSPRRLVACFQPHLYSRTKRLSREFGTALAVADLACVVDVYPARERAEDFPGVSGLLVAQAAADAAGGRPVWWLPTLEEAGGRLREELGEGDLLVTLGAGDVDRVAREMTAAGA